MIPGNYKMPITASIPVGQIFLSQGQVIIIVGTAIEFQHILGPLRLKSEGWRFGEKVITQRSGLGA